MRIPNAGQFAPGEYLVEELAERGWTTRDCAKRMGNKTDVDELALDLLIACAIHRDKRVVLGEELAKGLGRALGTSAELWIDLDRVWHEEATYSLSEDDEEIRKQELMNLFDRVSERAIAEKLSEAEKN